MGPTLPTICLTALLGMGCAARAPARIELSEKAVAGAIRKAQQYLLSKQGQDGSWAARGKHLDAATALTVHALLTSGHPRCDAPPIEKALRWLQGNQTGPAYCRGLRCLAWSSATWSGNFRHRADLNKDVRQLIRSTGADGRARTAGDDAGDRRNANFHAAWRERGVLAASEMNCEVPRRFWATVLKYWVKAQNADGGWGYGAGGPSNVPMTAAGLCAIEAARRELLGDAFVKVGQNRPYPSAVRARSWLDKHSADLFAGRLRGREDLPGCLFHLQKLAALTGRWHLAGKDLYRLGAAALLASQRTNGSWPGASPVVSTACALSFLSQRLQPILMSHLRYDGDWSNRPHAVGNLARWMGPQLCARLDWQVDDVRASVGEWSDARILLITGSTAPKLTAGDIDRLRRFVLRGGTIFSCTEGRGEGFGQGIRRLYPRLFPQYELAACNPTHKLYSIFFRQGGLPRLYEVSNGVRPLAIHCDEDLPLAWQLRLSLTRETLFRTAANVAKYVTEKSFPHPRAIPPWPDEAPFRPKLRVTLARVEHSANCDPEPLAYERFRRLMGRDFQVEVRVVGPVPAGKLLGSGAKIAVLSGTGELKLSAAEEDALKRFVAGGGTLLVEAVGGRAKFADSAGQLLRRLYGHDALQRMLLTHPLYRMRGLEIADVRYTLSARVFEPSGRSYRTKDPYLAGITVRGRLAVVFSREDLTAALLARPIYGCIGYRPKSAFAILRNLVLHAAGAKKKP